MRCPFKKVKYLRSGIAAAAGGCILISRHTLKRIGGIEAYHDAWIDDLALAKLVKRAGFSISPPLTKSVISILVLHHGYRMNDDRLQGTSS